MVYFDENCPRKMLTKEVSYRQTTNQQDEPIFDHSSALSLHLRPWIMHVSASRHEVKIIHFAILQII